jgi:DNA-binding ferritin-like protein (Dps family)
MDCAVGEVDDLIRKDFESLPNHIFQDKWKDIMTKYVTYLDKCEVKPNTALSWIASVRSFFSNEATSIKLQKGKLPQPEMAMGEHRFTLNEFRSMWLIADTEGKARLSTAVSLGWGVSDFAGLRTQFIREVISTVDDEGYCAFDYRRGKTQVRIRGVLNPDATRDLQNYLGRIPSGQEHLWTAKSKEGINLWLKSLCHQAGIKGNGQIRFHLIRKYVFDIVSSRCGVYEAKLLTGKKITLSDATYLHGLQDRVLERYKKFAYSFLKLNGEIEDKSGKVEKLIDKMDSLTMEVEEWKAIAIRTKKLNRDVEERMKQVELDLVDFKDYAVKASEISKQILLDNYYLINRLGEATGKSYDEIVTEPMTPSQKADYIKVSKLSDKDLPSKLEELDKILHGEWGKSGLEQIKQVEAEANRIVEKVSSAKKERDYLRERVRRKN